MSGIIEKARHVRRAAGLGGLALLAACQVVPPAPPPPAAPPPRPAPPPAVPVPTLEWDVAPVAPGDWSYAQAAGRTIARFGIAGGPPVLTMSCDLGRKSISLARAGTVSAATTMTVRTSAGPLAWAAVPGSDAAGQPAMVATRPASDTGFDWIAFSRGRISVEVGGMARLIVPAWAEMARVIEDCRG